MQAAGAVYPRTVRREAERGLDAVRGRFVPGSAPPAPPAHSEPLPLESVGVPVALDEDHGQADAADAATYPSRNR